MRTSSLLIVTLTFSYFGTPLSADPIAKHIVDYLKGCGKEYGLHPSDRDVADGKEKEALGVFEKLIAKDGYNCTDCHGRKASEETGAPYEPFRSFASFKSQAELDPKGFERDLKRMPPDRKHKKISEIDREKLVSWAKGLKNLTPKDSGFISFDVMLQCMAKDAKLLSQSRSVKRVRYFSLTHLHNAQENPQLEVFRSGISFLMNSLSWNPKITQPVAIDPFRTIYRIDMDDFDWPNDNWKALAKIDPYPVVPITSDGRRAMQSLQSVLGAKAPVVRGDWFVFVGSSPVTTKINPNPQIKRRFSDGLYEKLLGIDGNLKKFEDAIGVYHKVETKARRGKRGATQVSGVSQAQRTIELFPIPAKGNYDTKQLRDSLSPYYWVSYDYSLDKKATVPALKSVNQPETELGEDGGEFIASLPNGLQLYFVAKNDGVRLDSAPLDIATNKFDPQNSHVVYTGFSCMGCHNQGIFEMKDILDFSKGNGGAYAKEVYPPPDELIKLFQTQTKQFNDAVQLAIGSSPALPNPVFEGHSLHNGLLTVRLAAAELGVTEEDFISAYEKTKGIPFKPNLSIGKIEREFFAKNFVLFARELFGKAIDDSILANQPKDGNILFVYEELNSNTVPKNKGIDQALQSLGKVTHLTKFSSSSLREQLNNHSSVVIGGQPLGGAQFVKALEGASKALKQYVNRGGSLVLIAPFTQKRNLLKELGFNAAYGGQIVRGSHRLDVHRNPILTSKVRSHSFEGNNFNTYKVGAGESIETLMEANPYPVAVSKKVGKGRISILGFYYKFVFDYEKQFLAALVK